MDRIRLNVIKRKQNVRLKNCTYIFQTIKQQLSEIFFSQSAVYAAKHIQLSGTSRSTSIIGLMPGSFYNVSVIAASKNGHGPAVSEFFW
jgi:uncharacterized membrane protein AbrB (regulator of aidB expression)